MSKALVQCRFQKSPSDPVFDEIEEDFKQKKIIDSDFDETKERNRLLNDENLYEYSPLLLDFKDISAANAADGQHTMIHLYTHKSYCIKLNFGRFIAVYQQLIGVILNDFTDLDFDKEYGNNTK